MGRSIGRQSAVTIAAVVASVTPTYFATYAHVGRIFSPPVYCLDDGCWLQPSVCFAGASTIVIPVFAIVDHLGRIRCLRLSLPARAAIKEI